MSEVNGMDERLKEILSAMMDDEADELSVRRLLAHSDPEALRSHWHRWQTIRGLMHDEVPHVMPGDMAQKVRARIQGQPDASRDVATESALSERWRRPLRWRGSAVATVALALLLGFGAGVGWQVSPVAEQGAELAIQAAPEQLVADVPEIPLQGLDDQQWEHLSRYLLEHAQHNSVAAGRGSVGYARVVSVSSAGR